jgi:rhodanese-related sulfurtransferase
LADRLDELPRDETLLVICRSGGRSAVATETLVDAGFDAVNVTGGMLAWIDAGHPTHTGEG